jgi:hypothetical protein
LTALKMAAPSSSWTHHHLQRQVRHRPLSEEGCRLLGALVEGLDRTSTVPIDLGFLSAGTEPAEKPLPRQTVLDLSAPSTDSLNHDQILARALSHDLSLIGSILRVVEEEQKSIQANELDQLIPVKTQTILRMCVLAVPPAYVPAHMDGKEMVMAALLFLSSSIDIEAKVTAASGLGKDISKEEVADVAAVPFSFLPLLQPQPQPGASIGVDLDKLAYLKAHTWSFSDLVARGVVDQLEQVFVRGLPAPTRSTDSGDSTVSLKWLGRGHFLPRFHMQGANGAGDALSEEDVARILRKGVTFAGPSRQKKTPSKNVPSAPPLKKVKLTPLFPKQN